ncbi:MAG: hypothetical protein J6O50_14020 [Ruminiclostridium sp.]|nr:hypothetical protein [Ruminiclostridium sp.]
MKVLSIILKVIETGIVCIWGVAVGIFFPVVIMISGSDVIPIAEQTHIMVVWLVTAAVGYVLSAALIFGKHYRVAAALSVIGLVGVLVLNGMFDALYAQKDFTSAPHDLYLPLIFATLLDIFILAIEERRNITKLFEDSKAKKEEKAPSILGDDADNE